MVLSFQVLDLGGVDMSRKSAPSLAALVSSHHALRKLNLCENELGDRGTVLVVGGISVSHR